MKFIVSCQHKLFSTSLCQLINNYSDQMKVLEANNIESVLRIAKKNSDIDLIVFYMEMSDNGWDRLYRLRNELSKSSIMVIADFESNEQIRKAIFMGADGCVSSNFTWRTVTNVIRRIMNGEIVSPSLSYSVEKESSDSDPHTRSNYSASPEKKIRLTPRQEEVLQLIRTGNSNKEIARELDMALSTVKIHCAAIFKELGVSNRTQAAIGAEKYFCR